MDKKRMKGRIIAVIVLLVSLVYGGFTLTRDVVGLGGADYKRKNSTTFEYKKGKIVKEGDHFLITMKEQEMEVLFLAEDYHVTLTFPDGTSLDGYYAGGALVNEKGMPLYMNGTDSHVSVTVYGDNPDLSEISYYDIGCELSRIYFDDFDHSGVFGLMFMGFVFYALGFLTFFYPEQVFFFGSRWAYRNPELSDSGILFQQIGGVLIMAMGAVTMSGIIINIL